MRTLARTFAAVVLVAALGSSAGCQPTVEVRTGTKVVCTYGHVVSNDIKKVRVPAEDAGKYRVRTVTRICTLHSKAEALYREAQAAIVAGDLDAAKAKLEQVVSLDSAFRSARAQLDTIAKGDKPAPDSAAPGGGSSTPTSTPEKPGEGDTSSPAASLLKWAPDNLGGFTASEPTLDALGIAREYVPDSGSSVVSLVIVAEQDRTAAGAKAALKSQIKDAYTRDVATVKVGGRTAYFGTDGRRFAVVGLTDGSVMVAAEMSGRPGGSPADLKSALVRVLEQLP